MSLKLSQRADAGRSILAQIDLDKVIAEIKDGPEGPLGFDHAAAAQLVWTACEKWLARDTEQMILNGIEDRYEWNGESGVVDCHGVFTKLAHEKYRGKRFVRDWKTSATELNTAWADIYRLSWQWRFYLYHLDADIFIYSGVSLYDGGTTRELIIPRPDDLETQVINQLQGLNVMAQGLIDSGLEVFPRNMPESCRKFGGCPYAEDCETETMPRKALETWRWSPSSMEAFLRCPEYHRRNALNKIAGVRAADTKSTALGGAFHRGMAEVYRQVYGIESCETSLTVITSET